MRQLILLLLFGTFSLTAQEVKTLEKSMSLGPQPSYYIEINDIDEKVVKKEWENYLEEYFKKVKYNRKAKEFYTQDGSVSVINGSTPITIYSSIEEGREQITLYTWIELSDGLVSDEKYSKQAEGVRNFLSDFYIIAKKKGISIELEKHEDSLKDLEKDLSKLEKKNKDLHDDIEDYKEKIRRAESDIEQNLREQDDKKIQIEEQKKLVEATIERLNSVGKNY